MKMPKYFGTKGVRFNLWKTVEINRATPFNFSRRITIDNMRLIKGVMLLVSLLSFSAYCLALLLIAKKTRHFT